jgi:hypothetical protein
MDKLLASMKQRNTPVKAPSAEPTSAPGGTNSGVPNPGVTNQHGAAK